LDVEKRDLWVGLGVPAQRGSVVGLSALAFLLALRLRSVTNKKSSNKASIPHAAGGANCPHPQSLSLWRGKRSLLPEGNPKNSMILLK